MKTKVELQGVPEFVEAMARLDDALQTKATAVIEMAALKSVQDHLDDQYVPRQNALGGPSTGYWATVRNSAAAEVDGGAVTVSLTGVGLRMKYEGDVIRPSGRVSTVTGKPIKFLSIPVDAQAHGKVPAEFGKKLYVRGFAGGMGRSEGDSAQGSGLWLRQGRRAADSDPLLFWLVKKVTIKADKGIFPPGPATAAACVAAVTNLIETQTS